MTDTNVEGWVFYDGECHLCIELVERFRPLMIRCGFGIAPLQQSWVQKRLGLRPDSPVREMVFLAKDGKQYGGGDAILAIAKNMRWSRPLAHVAALFGLRPLLHLVYRYIAANRHCFNGACEVRSLRRKEPLHASLDSRSYVLPLVLLGFLLLPTSAILLTRHTAPWIMMWLVAFSMWVGSKGLTLWRARRILPATSTGRLAGYLLGWPGMNASTFLNRLQGAPPAPSSAATFAFLRIALGALTLWGLSRLLFEISPILAGWSGLIGMVLLLHFGLFDVLSFLWRRAGIHAPALMNRPLGSRSVGEFWNSRWNIAFHELAQAFVFKPVQKRFGWVAATAAVFLTSGIIHDVVISLPARGGYGLPTAYFALQGLALVCERSPAGRRLGLGNGWRGRVFAIAVIALPAFWLFHPQFLRVVILPFMEAIGAL